MKKKLLIIGLYWILWAIGMEYITEYVFNRPTDGTLQFLTLIFLLTMTVLLIRKTYLCIINNLNK